MNISPPTVAFIVFLITPFGCTPTDTSDSDSSTDTSDTVVPVDTSSDDSPIPEEEVEFSYTYAHHAYDCTVSDVRAQRLKRHWPTFGTGCEKLSGTQKFADVFGNCVVVPGRCGTSDPWLTTCDKATLDRCCAGRVPEQPCADLPDWPFSDHPPHDQE